MSEMTKKKTEYEKWFRAYCWERRKDPIYLSKLHLDTLVSGNVPNDIENFSNQAFHYCLDVSVILARTAANAQNVALSQRLIAFQTILALNRLSKTYGPVPDSLGLAIVSAEIDDDISLSLRVINQIVESNEFWEQWSDQVRIGLSNNAIKLAMDIEDDALETRQSCSIVAEELLKRVMSRMRTRYLPRCISNSTANNVDE